MVNPNHKLVHAVAYHQCGIHQLLQMKHPLSSHQVQQVAVWGPTASLTTVAAEQVLVPEQSSLCSCVLSIEAASSSGM